MHLKYVVWLYNTRPPDRVNVED